MKQFSDKHETLTGYDFTVDTALPPRKAIRQKCLECVCGSSVEVQRCHITDCTLWPYRLGRGIQDGQGKRYRTTMSDERKAALSEKMKQRIAKKARP